jgi:uncharacterized protein YceK
MANAKAKSAGSSWTIWFGILSIALGGAISILALLGQQDIIDLNTGVWATVSGILTIALRIKTKVAIALKIDDPTTPEDESKGEIAMTGKGFANLVTMAALTVLAAATLLLGGCGTVFTAKSGEPVTAAFKVSMPGKVVVKVATKTACTVNAPDGRVLLQNQCAANEVPWYVGYEPTCITNTCALGALMHNADGTVSCQ